jgi:LAO/AO transport system kinase
VSDATITGSAVAAPRDPIARVLDDLRAGRPAGIARAVSIVENHRPGFDRLLASLHPSLGHARRIGITGPPGAGKSTLTDGLIGEIVGRGHTVAVLCVDPSSPFNLGAVLGDRIRMSEWYTHPNVYIRSLATRGSMGGLNPKIIEISDLIGAAPFDFLIVETVGVGQSEIEIAGLAELTVVVVVPEAGDEVQTMKAGLMEIADLFVVNKSDRPDADTFVRNLRSMLAPAFSRKSVEIPVIKTVAHERKGLAELFTALQNGLGAPLLHERKIWLLTEKAFQLIQRERMHGIDKENIRDLIRNESGEGGVNLYRLVRRFAVP